MTMSPEPAKSGEAAGPVSLVLGGGGFIGTNLCRALRAQGARVRGFGRSRLFPEALEGIAWTEGALSDAADLKRVIDGADIVYYLIGDGLPETSNRNPVTSAMSAIGTAVRLLDACRACKVRRVVFASSGGTVYGVAPHLPIPENAPTDPISAYGIHKLAIEKYLGLYRHLHGLDYAVLRIANAYGPFQPMRRRHGVIPALAGQALRGEPLQIWGDGQVVRDFVHVADVVEAMRVLAAYTGPHRVFNVGSGEGRSIASVAADIETVLGGGPLPRAFLPGQSADVPANVLDISLIAQETGWRPRTPWLTGLADTIDWLRANADHTPDRDAAA